MNKETIEKAAKDYGLQDISTTGVYARAKLIEGFKIGAQWRIDSAWHDAEKETPEQGEQIIILYYNGIVELEELNGNWDLAGTYYGAIRWAYVADLLPERKEKL